MPRDVEQVAGGPDREPDGAVLAESRQLREGALASWPVASGARHAQQLLVERAQGI